MSILYATNWFHELCVFTGRKLTAALINPEVYFYSGSGNGCNRCSPEDRRLSNGGEEMSAFPHQLPFSLGKGNFSNTHQSAANSFHVHSLPILGIMSSIQDGKFPKKNPLLLSLSITPQLGVRSLTKEVRRMNRSWRNLCVLILIVGWAYCHSGVSKTHCFTFVSMLWT